MASKINFTKAEIDALPIPEHGKRDNHQDSKVAGLKYKNFAYKR